MADPEITLDGPKPSNKQELSVEENEKLLKEKTDLQEKIQEQTKKMQEMKELDPKGALALLMLLFLQWRNFKNLEKNEKSLKTVDSNLPDTPKPEGGNKEVGLKISSQTEEPKIDLKNQEQGLTPDSTLENDTKIIDNAIDKVENLMETMPKELDEFENQEQVEVTQNQIQSLKNDLTTLLQKDIQRLESGESLETKKESTKPEPTVEQEETKKTEAPQPEDPKLNTKESMSPVTKIEEKPESKSEKTISEKKQAFFDSRKELKGKLLSTIEDVGELTGDPERDAQQVAKSIYKWFESIEQLIDFLKTLMAHKSDKSIESLEEGLNSKPGQEGRITLDSPEPNRSTLEPENNFSPPKPGSELVDEAPIPPLPEGDIPELGPTPSTLPAHDFVPSPPNEKLDSSNLNARLLDVTSKLSANPEVEAPQNIESKTLTPSFTTQKQHEPPLKEMTPQAQKLDELTQQTPQQNKTPSPSLKNTTRH